MTGFPVGLVPVMTGHPVMTGTSSPVKTGTGAPLPTPKPTLPIEILDKLIKNN
jgi:hypothetical protein